MFRTKMSTFLLFVNTFRCLEREFPTLFLLFGNTLWMLGTKKFASMVSSGVALGRGTSVSRETLEEKALRTACANQMVVALMSFLHADTSAKDKIIVSVATPWEQYFGKGKCEVSINHRVARIFDRLS